MMTSSNGNILRVTGHLCREFAGPGEFPAQRPVTRSFGVFFDLRLNKRSSKQPWGWWFETPSWSLLRHCNDVLSRLDAVKPTKYEYDSNDPTYTFVEAQLPTYILTNGSLVNPTTGVFPTILAPGWPAISNNSTRLLYRGYHYEY